MQNHYDDEQLKYKSLGSQVADIIRTKIVTGEYAQGLRITEGEFSKGLGVSHSCVRDAFSILEADGLVESVRNKYTKVVEFDPHDIGEIYSIRLAVEKLCAETCIQRRSISTDNLREKANLISLNFMEETEAIMKSVEADIAFHEIIIYSSRNMRAVKIWKTLRYQMETLLYSINRGASNKWMSVNTRDHDELIKGFEESDLDRIHSLLVVHIESGMYTCLKYNKAGNHDERADIAGENHRGGKSQDA